MNIFAATGHRPEKLGGHGAQTDARLRRLAAWFFATNRPDKVISGMALGWDMAWAEAAIEARIPVIAAVPFGGQESRWPAVSQDRFWRILTQSEETVIVCEGSYAAWKMQKRNQWMVDKASHLIALWDGTSGGTANCVGYADGRIPTHNLWSYWSSNAF